MDHPAGILAGESFTKYPSLASVTSQITANRARKDFVAEGSFSRMRSR